MKRPPVEKDNYRELTPDLQRKMVQQALLQLEQKHFESVMNIVISKTRRDDHERWLRTRDQLQEQLDLLRAEYAALLEETPAVLADETRN